jgi:hypothetical protein
MPVVDEVCMTIVAVEIFQLMIAVMSQYLRGLRVYIYIMTIRNMAGIENVYT